MEIIDLLEPGQDVASDAEIIVGIDFGTTNSLIAMVKNGEVLVAKDNKSCLLKSVVFYQAEADKLLTKVGECEDSKGWFSIRSIKRLLAKSAGAIKNNSFLSKLHTGEYALSSGDASAPKVLTGAGEFSLPYFASKIFEQLKINAEENWGLKISKAVVSVPAYFDDLERGQVLLAARMAGIDVVRLMAEPTAAAYAYGLQDRKEIMSGCFLVYDFGGGTFDASLLNMQAGVMQVIALGAITCLEVMT
jgi:molecular chaperone HscA